MKEARQKGYKLYESFYIDLPEKANPQIQKDTESRLVVARGWKDREMVSEC